jgi:hypothetical protein
MSRKDLATSPTRAGFTAAPAATPARAVTRPVLLCIAAFIVCTLVSVAPLNRLAGQTFLLYLPTNPLLLGWGSWLPYNLRPRASMITTNDLAFLILMALAFVIYGLGALFISRQPLQADYRRMLRLVCLGSFLVGLIYLFTPALLSRDLYVYADYGRLIVAYHANPYFTARAAFPQDPITSLDGWANATSAYGPVWLAICSFWSLLIGASPLGYLFAFRLFALAAHLLNTLLVAANLRGLGRPPRTIALGAFLYALNPLALMESSLGAHNDTFMVTLILLGILLCRRAEQDGFARPSRYLPPVLAFTMAALVKFAAAPIIVFYVIVIACYEFRRRAPGAVSPGRKASRIAVSLLAAARGSRKILTTVGGAFALALVLYAPFWFGHGIRAIVGSFSTPPSAYFAQNSFLRAIYNAGLPTKASWTYLPHSILSQHGLWNAISLFTLLFFMCLGGIWLRRAPGTQTLMLVTLTTLGALLIVTPWFFAWYVTWLVALACACLASGVRYGRGLLAFAFTFSVTALTTYLFNNYPPIGVWSGLALLIMDVPLLIAFLFFSLRGGQSGFLNSRRPA